MQPPPPGMMMAAEASRRQAMNMLMTLFLVLGLLLLAVAGMVWSYGNLGVPATTRSQDQVNMQTVYAPIVWNLGMFLLIFAILGMALMRQDMDPMARLLMYMVAFIIILLIFVAPSLFFNGTP